jgi:hypothetical protein
MAVRRLAAVVPLFLSGCLVPSPLPATATPPPAAPRDGFAALVPAPGQAVPLNPPADRPTAVATAARPAPVEPPAGAVAPPEVAPAPPAPPPTRQASADAPLLGPDPAGLRPPASAPPLLLALQAHLDDRPEAAAEHLRGFGRPNQELLTHLLPAVAAARHADLGGHGSKGTAALARQLAAATELVAEAAPLAIRKAVFVSKVEMFGRYEPMPAGHRFLAGGRGCMLYLELENAPSLPVALPGGGAGYVTRLDGTARIHDAAGQAVEQPDEQTGRPTTAVRFAVTETARSPLRDVYGLYEFPLPSRPGRYTLTVELRDPNSGRTARATVDFVVSER